MIDLILLAGAGFATILTLVTAYQLGCAIRDYFEERR